MNTFKTIDESTWDRAIHCSIFRNSLEPAFCITFEVDVTGFKKKDEGTKSLLHFRNGTHCQQNC